MNMSRMMAIVGLVLLTLTLPMRIAYAIGASNNVSNGQVDSHVVEVKAWLGADQADTSKAYSVTEQVILTIDISTPRWFVGPTTIGHIDIPNLVVKQRNALATNYTSRKDGETWAHQRWELTLYPQSSGTFTIPALPITVNIAGDNAKKTQGTLWTNKLSLQARLPSGKLTEKDQWFAASNVTVTQDWQTTREGMKVGDAVTRTIKIEANDSLSILLPQVLKSQSKPQYQSYADPAQLIDKSVRGDYLSSRQDQVVYVLQEGGKVSFPDLHLKWWNTKENKVESVTLKGKAFSVTHTPRSFIKTYWSVIVSIVVALIVIVLLVIGIKRYFKTHEQPLALQYQRSIWNKNFAQSRLLLYIKLKRITQYYAFNESAELADIGEGIIEEGSTSHWKGFWRRIKPASRTARSLLTPLKLNETLKNMNKH
ncbi:BatD family protein [Vibrio rumoiensis]|uniref:Protein BatD n=1 Tax=Vibrio rumoiensis 1S-45 TaxID=1188252 RepID=A0A1E5E2X4_9VIBR|nr:BatD family protein [Vibrio rumoiensis]OEF25580.1 hypothetical protein A1QC_01485 [Vibrio rumoiensis 1S-45]